MFFFVGVATSCYVSYNVGSSRVGLFIFFRLPIWPFRDPRQWTMNSSHQIKFNNRSPSFIIYCSLWDYNKWCIELITVQSIKPWPNGLASQRKTSVRLVSNLRFVWPATCVVLHGLAYASRRKFSTVWPPNASRHKLIASQLYTIEIYDFLQLVNLGLNLRTALRIRLATHRKSVRKFWFWKLASTCESVWQIDVLGSNSIKKYKCTLQVGPSFLQIHTNLDPLKAFTSSH